MAPPKHLDEIDEDCIEIMSDDELKKYIPKYGDRLALRTFVGKAKAKKNSNDRKHSLLDQLRAKLQKRPTDEKVETVKATKLPNAVKASKKVAVGLMRYDYIQKGFRQVRTKSGGGTRTFTMPKSAKKEDLIEESLKVFFPENMSARFGSMEDYVFDIMDYQGIPLSNLLTIQQVSDLTKLPNLRFYLSMRKLIDPEEQPSGKETKSLRNDQPSEVNQTANSYAACSTAKQSCHETNSDGTDQHSGIEHISASFYAANACSTSESSCNVTNCDRKNAACGSSYETTSYDVRSDEFYDEELPDINFSSTETHGEAPNTNLGLDEVDFLATVSHLNEEQHNFEHHTIQLHRGHVFNELSKQFSNKYDFTFDIFTFEMILPNGEKEIAADNGGVLRDALVEFWDSFYEQCTLGRDFKVPFLRHDFSEENWRAVARVLYYGWKEQKYFPVRLSKAFMSCCIYGMDTFASSHETLVKEFLSYIPQSESKAVSNALGGDFDEEELLEILGAHECRVCPTSENLNKLLGEIAHKEIIQQPMYVKECWFHELASLGFDLGITSLELLYDRLTPNNRKVCKILCYPEVMTPTQTTTANFLRKFVREMEPGILSQFLRFCTGSDVLLMNGEHDYWNISVRFTNLTGLARRPVAHTCGRVLEIPEQFENFLEFRSEFSSVLKSDVWVMDFV